MAFNAIDPTTPAGNEKIKFGDDRIREFKAQAIANFKEISNYPATTKPALRTAVWTTATRPAGAELVDRVSGYNTDLGCDEYYDLATTSWKVKGGAIPAWTVSGRPAAPYIGQCGYNTEIAIQERWTGTVWQRISGGQRGDVKMWSGSVADIPTRNPGWVLADGIERDHPEGGKVTPPDLRNRFIVGAGADSGTYTPGHDATAGIGNYAPGATGGEDKHTQTIAETPSHTHTFPRRMGFSNEPGQDGGVAGSGFYQGAWVGDGTTRSTGDSGAHENRPPYYALCFLYKV